MAIYALLDFDGYICKAFYAANSKRGADKSAYEILDSLYTSAISKTAQFFNVDESEVRAIPVVSTHSWKKDVYPKYKAHRKRNEELGRFRDEIINNNEDIVKVEQLEADEVVIMLDEYITNNLCETSVIFSDDKDLKYYSSYYCKINLTEEINDATGIANKINMYAQMLAGDKEDNITGIPKVGMKTAEKLLKQSPDELNLDKVIKIYKNQNVSYNDCLEQLALVIPVCAEFSTESMPAICIADSIVSNTPIDDELVQIAIGSQLEYIKGRADLIYG